MLLASQVAAALVARPYFVAHPAGFHLTEETYWLGIALTGALYWAVWMTTLSVHDSRKPAVFGTGAEEYNRVIGATVTAIGLVTVGLFLFFVPPQRSFLIVECLALVPLLLGRWLWRKRLHAQRRKQRNSYRTLLVGDRAKSRHIARQLRANPLAGFTIVGAVTAADSEGELLPGLPAAAGFDELMPSLDEFKVDTVIVTSADSLTPRKLRQLGWELEARKIDLIVATALTDVAGPRIHTRPVAGLPLTHVAYPSFSGWRYASKRALDVILASIGLIVTAPALAVFAALIKRDSPGPVFFSQQRVGLNGKPFTMYKLRSMTVDAEEQLAGLLDHNDGNGVQFKMFDDPRVTRVGRFIRKHSIDELPQLLNVVKGDMSLIGPRPPLVHEAAGYEAWVQRRLLIRPGMSGLWQVSGRSDLSWEESVRLDLNYVENWSLIADMLILWRTIRTVVKAEGAY